MPNGCGGGAMRSAAANNPTAKAASIPFKPDPAMEGVMEIVYFCAGSFHPLCRNIARSLRMVSRDAEDAHPKIVMEGSPMADACTAIRIASLLFREATAEKSSTSMPEHYHSCLTAS